MQKISPSITVKSPEISRVRWSAELPKETLDEIGNSYLLQALKDKKSFEEHYLRLRRRHRALAIYDFLVGIEDKKSHSIGNALFVHDDPIDPGSARYLVNERSVIDEETDKRLKEKTEAQGREYKRSKPVVKRKNRVDLAQITKERFPDTDYIFAGHSHLLPGMFENNGVNIVYVGGVGIPRVDNRKQKYACYTIVTFNDKNRVISVTPKRLVYFWQKTRRKMQENNLPDKFKIK
jgi:hypothetical protein